MNGYGEDDRIVELSINVMAAANSDEQPPMVFDDPAEAFAGGWFHNSTSMT